MKFYQIQPNLDMVVTLICYDAIIHFIFLLIQKLVEVGSYKILVNHEFKAQSIKL
jgi:hypothetical protein